MSKNKTEYSTNEHAKKIMGLRKTKTDDGRMILSLDFPCELDYHCPVCEYDLVNEDGNFDERLHWSEYNSFVWCSVCNRDFPSALCIPLSGDGVDRAIDVFLLSAEAVAKKRTSDLMNLLSVIRNLDPTLEEMKLWQEVVGDEL